MGAVDHRQQPTASRIMPSGVLDATPHGEGTSAPLAVDRSDNSSSVPGPHTPLPAVDMSDKRDKVPAAGVLAPTDAKSDQGDSAAELDTPAPAGEDSSGLLGDNDVVDRASSSSSSESGSSSDSDDSSSSAVSTEPASTDSGTKDSSTDTANAQPATAQPAEVQPSEPDPAAMQSSVISRQSQQLSRHSIHSAPLNLANLSEAVKEKLGYSLHVAPSGISHADAGQGLWLEGRAPVGAVVALYPGLVYSPMHYR